MQSGTVFPSQYTGIGAGNGTNRGTILRMQLR